MRRIIFCGNFVILAIVIFLAATFPIAAEDSFGFGEVDNATTGEGNGGARFGASVSGIVGMEILGFVTEFDKPADTTLGGNFNGKLNFEAHGSNVKGLINLNIKTQNIDFSSFIDEAYLQAYFGDFEIESGLRKLTWGKADSFGPLDVINYYDYSELTNMADTMELKRAVPLIHASYRIGQFSKIEAVALPWFSPHSFAESGRWAQLPPLPMYRPSDDDLKKLNYAQAGARFTTTIGSADIGAQYFYGRMYQPAVHVVFSGMYPAGIEFDYNRYQQIGVDYAQVIAGFNIRAEAGANLTDDLNGDDGAVYNPAIVWSLGFDRDLFWGINLNLQCNESIRLMNDKVLGNPLDIEAGRDITSSRIIAKLSKKFLRDDLEVRAVGIIGVEDKDFLIVPGVFWAIQDVQLEFSSGIFGGDKDGQLGHFHDNTFVKIGVKYAF
jgi:hypothetical protein